MISKSIGLAVASVTKKESRPRKKEESFTALRDAALFLSLFAILTNKKARLENIEFNTNGNIIDFGIPKQELLEIINTGEPFLTSGCPGCNRPYYNERPRGPFYNYPRNLTTKEIEKAKIELGF